MQRQGCSALWPVQVTLQDKYWGSGPLSLQEVPYEDITCVLRSCHTFLPQIWHSQWVVWLLFWIKVAVSEVSHIHMCFTMGLCGGLNSNFKRTGHPVGQLALQHGSRRIWARRSAFPTKFVLPSLWNDVWAIKKGSFRGIRYSFSAMFWNFYKQST